MNRSRRSVTLRNVENAGRDDANDEEKAFDKAATKEALGALLVDRLVGMQRVVRIPQRHDQLALTQPQTVGMHALSRRYA